MTRDSLPPGYDPTTGKPVYEPETGLPAICIPPCDTCEPLYVVLLSGIPGEGFPPNDCEAANGEWFLTPEEPLGETCMYSFAVPGTADAPIGIWSRIWVRLYRIYIESNFPSWFVCAAREKDATGEVWGCEWIFGPYSGVCPPDDATEFPCYATGGSPGCPEEDTPVCTVSAA
jgi:hypothetical protein